MTATIAGTSHAVTLDTATTRVTAAGRLSVTVVRDFCSIEGLWSMMQRESHATPYQHLEWCQQYYQQVLCHAGAEPAFVVIREKNGEPLMLLPLVVEKRGPLRIAEFIGGKHANFNMPLFSEGAARLTAEQIFDALQQAASLASLDCYAFFAQPHAWEGVKNPLASLGGITSPSFGYKLALQSDGEALLQGRLSKDTRKKLRQKESKLASMGTVSYRRPKTAEEALLVLDAFLAMKAERFQTQGIDDPFAGAAIQRFMQQAVTENFDLGRPTIELHALYLDEKAISVYGAVCDDTRFCGLFTAFDATPDIARSTPGDILLMAMIKDCCARGMKTFDLGVGEARYKQQVCDAQEMLMDRFVPASVPGWLYAQTCELKQKAKRWIKHSATGKTLIAKLRQMKAAKAA